MASGSPPKPDHPGHRVASRAVGFFLGDENAEANILNENDVATIIRENGFRLWGNHTTTTDAQLQFLSTRRILDMVNESVMRAHLWAVDRCITRTFLQDVRESVASYLRSLEARGAILGSDVFIDPDATATDVANGQITIDFEFTPVYPAERVRFRSILTNNYIESILTDSNADDESVNEDGDENAPDTRRPPPVEMNQHLQLRTEPCCHALSEIFHSSSTARLCWLRH